LDDLDLDGYYAIQRALINRLGTDPAVKDLPRLMRLSGTRHLKDPQVPRLVKLVEIGPRWTLEALLTRMARAGVSRENSGNAFGSSAASTGIGPIPGSCALPVSLNADLLAGIEPACWFEKFSAEDKDACLRELLAACSDVAASSAREPWISILMAAHASGAPYAEEIALDWCRGGGAAFCGDDEFARQWQSLGRPGVSHRITISTLIHHAALRGFQATPWRERVQPSGAAHSATMVHSGTGGPILAARGSSLNLGGTYSEAEALELLNQRFFVGISDQETGIFRIHDSGTVTHLPDKDFKLLIDNVRVRTTPTRLCRLKSSGVRIRTATSAVSSSTHGVRWALENITSGVALP
jgi:hypothetical protein